MIEVAGEIRGREQLPPPCAEVRDLLYAEAEGEKLSSEELRALEGHVAGCAVCAAERTRVRNFTTNISDLLKTLKPAVDLRKKVLAKIEVKSERTRLWKAAAALGGAVALAAVVLMISGERPIAQLAYRSGSPRLLRLSGENHREIPVTRELMNGDRIEIAAEETATVVAAFGEVALEGPACVQLERGRAGGYKVHVLDEATLRGSAEGQARFGIRAGELSIDASGARFEIKVDAEGTCRMWAVGGVLRVVTQSGRHEVAAGSGLHVDQKGAVKSE